MKKTLIPQILKQERNKHGYTPEQVITMLSERGYDISVKTLYAYEAGTNLPKVTVFLALCDIYEIGNIMSCFGYKQQICTPENEWHTDMYNDFFNAPLRDKILILLENGIPSFDGYENVLESLFPSDADSANFNRLYKSFMQLDESDQIRVMERAETLLSDPKYNKTTPSNEEAV